MVKIKYRNYINGDEARILDLFKDAFQREMSLDYWNWRYVQNPENHMLIRLVYDEEKLVGHYALSPVLICIGGVEYSAALSMTTMTHPDYQGMGLFKTLATQLFENEYDKLDLIYGVPNENSIEGFIKYLDFQLIKEIPMLQLNINEEIYNVDERCVEINKFDGRFDYLNEIMIKKYDVMISRTKEYLNWRYILNPQNKYRKFAYIKNGEVLGYIITKTFQDESGLSGDIVDLLVKDEEALEALLKNAFHSFKMNKIKLITTWNSDQDIVKYMKNMGFIETSKKFYFIVKDNLELLSEKIFSFENWYLTMGDIDIF